MHDPPNISSATALHVEYTDFKHIMELSLEHLLLRVRPPPDNHGPLNCFVSIRENVQDIYVVIANAVLPHQNQKYPWQISLIECRPEQRDRQTLDLNLHYTVCIFYAYPYHGMDIDPS